MIPDSEFYFKLDARGVSSLVGKLQHERINHIGQKFGLDAAQYFATVAMKTFAREQRFGT